MFARLGVAFLMVVAMSFGSLGAHASVDWHGFVEGAYGIRTSDEDDRDYTLDEARVQLKLSAYGSMGEGFLRADLINDQVDSGENLEIREGFLRFSTLSNHLDVKAGRQISTWGTGDLLFINDLFPKDWVSFFIGREDQYLKAPADAVRLGIFGLPADVDFVWSPTFTPDRVPTGGRLSFYAPPMVQAPTLRPGKDFENSEFALRMSRYVGNYTIALYGYRGFYKTPMGITGPHAFHPKLNVYGASARGGVLSGVAWLEGGLYDSRQDRDGDNPLIPNSTLRYLAGFERQVATDLNVGVQYYGELMMDHDTYMETLPQGAPEQDEVRHLLTLRVEKMLKYQTIRLSGFAFYSPSDEDFYFRPFISYKLSDEIEVVGGANIFYGEESTTQFGQFDSNDNVYARLRYSF
jgi:hypothetical protein